uniref:Uncharacterized protein n=1 Tax=Oryza brachyantha TaxID=4533 RepID=J3LQV8_ORYBR
MSKTCLASETAADTNGGDCGGRQPEMAEKIDGHRRWWWSIHDPLMYGPCSSYRQHLRTDAMLPPCCRDIHNALVASRWKVGSDQHQMCNLLAAASLQLIRHSSIVFFCQATTIQCT